jgi:DNA polymerase III subunit gamma/tau
VALALYRKYRPAKLAEVVGQEHVTEPLTAAIGAGRINHAYLFSGPRGCGKTSSARILARSLNCEQGPTPDPCGVCASCVSLAPGGPGNIDVTELDAASHGGVDDTRELRDRAFFAPAESRYRVFIVDEAHMITTQGFNALLKIVEEPPEHLVFVFATTEPDKVLPTIRSRTHHYPFRLIPPGTLRKLLERICAEEGVVVAPAVYPLVIRAGGGSARDSLSVLDQLLAGAGAEGVTYERAVALLGVTDVSLIDDVVDALAAGDRAAVFDAVDRLVEAGHDPRRFAADLLQRLRDVTLLQAVPEAVERGLVEAADDELARMVEQASKLGAATLARYGEILHTGLIEMRGATAPRLLLELLCARMLLPAASPAEAGLLERLERLERRSDIAAAPAASADAGVSGKRTFRRPSEPAPAAEAPPPAEKAPAEPPPAEPAAASPVARTEPAAPAARPGPAAVEEAAKPEPALPSSVDAAAVRRVWSEILAAARAQSRSIEAMLVNATVRAVENDTLVLSIGAPSLARRLSEQRNVEIISGALHTVLGVRWQVRCVSGDAGQPAPAAPRRAAAPPPASPPARNPPARRPVPPDDGVPLPPEPPDDDVPPDDEESMLAEAAAAGPAAPTERRDPEEAAIELLSTQLGARALDRR